MISTWAFLLHFPYDEPSAKMLEKSHAQIVNLLVKDRWEPLPERVIIGGMLSSKEACKNPFVNQ
jgi:hypothetical protein